MIHVDAKDLAEQDVQVLRVAVRAARLVRVLLVDVVLVPAVARAEVEKTIRAERDAPAVVVEIRMIQLQQNPFRAEVRRVALRGELRDRHRVVPVRRRSRAQWRAVAHVELVVRGELRMQRQPQHAAFIELAEVDFQLL